MTEMPENWEVTDRENGDFVFGICDTMNDPVQSQGIQYIQNPLTMIIWKWIINHIL